MSLTCTSGTSVISVIICSTYFIKFPNNCWKTLMNLRKNHYKYQQFYFWYHHNCKISIDFVKSINIFSHLCSISKWSSLSITQQTLQPFEQFYPFNGFVEYERILYNFFPPKGFYTKIQTNCQTWFYCIFAQLFDWNVL